MQNITQENGKCPSHKSGYKKTKPMEVKTFSPDVADEKMIFIVDNVKEFEIRKQVFGKNGQYRNFWQNG